MLESVLCQCYLITASETCGFWWR